VFSLRQLSPSHFPCPHLLHAERRAAAPQLLMGVGARLHAWRSREYLARWTLSGKPAAAAADGRTLDRFVESTPRVSMRAVTE